MLVLVLGWTQCLPQGDARLASPKNWAAGPPERRGRWIQFAQCSPRQSPRLWHCGTPTTGRLYPFGANCFLFVNVGMFYEYNILVGFGCTSAEKRGQNELC